MKAKKLAIRGKLISIEKIAEKTLPQFANQLRQNGISLGNEEVKALYESLTREDEDRSSSKKAEREKRHEELRAKKKNVEQ